MNFPELGTSIVALAGSKIGILIGAYVVLQVVMRLMKSGSKGGYSKGGSYGGYPKGSKGALKEREAHREAVAQEKQDHEAFFHSDKFKSYEKLHRSSEAMEKKAKRRLGLGL